MTTSLTQSQIKNTYGQLLHISGGLTGTEKTVYNGAGDATALKVGTGSVSVDDVRLDGNVITTVGLNQDLVLSPNGTGTVAISKVHITGGTIEGVAALSIASGGTGAATKETARISLGLGTIATQNSNNVTVTGGSISGVSSIAGTALTAGGDAAALGYAGAGTGGVVTQTVNRATAVTLNKICGQIKLVNAALTYNTAFEFTLNNNKIAATDMVCVEVLSATPNRRFYIARVTQISANSCVISVGNWGSVTTSNIALDAPTVRFTVIKGAIA